MLTRWIGAGGQNEPVSARTVRSGLELRAQAAAVLREDDAGRYTVPSRELYPHQWNWDSALCALGWVELSPERAWDELGSLVAARDQRGMLAHIAFRRRRLRRPGREGPVLGRFASAHPAGYLPGPPWWGPRLGRDGRAISGITQPPLAASSLRFLYERAPDDRRVRTLLLPVHAWHGFLLSERDPDGRGEPVLIHPWESGRDNAPEWDRPLLRVAPRLMHVRRRDTARVDAAERPSNEHYRRYLALVTAGTDAGWAQRRLAAEGPFRVLDAAFSGALSRACDDLAAVADAVGERGVADESRAWCERVALALRSRARSDGLVPAIDLEDGAELRAPSVGLALTALAPGLERRTVDAARELVTGELSSPFGVRSHARGAQGWSPRNYWRGPVWANVTWLCARALALHGEARVAKSLYERLLRTVREAGMREYFEPDLGVGLGARDFAWTAALTLRVLADTSQESER
jgi:hypothetical protein